VKRSHYIRKYLPDLEYASTELLLSAACALNPESIRPSIQSNSQTHAPTGKKGVSHMYATAPALREREKERKKKKKKKKKKKRKMEQNKNRL
jgi:hypothetical protein